MLVNTVVSSDCYGFQVISMDNIHLDQSGVIVRSSLVMILKPRSFSSMERDSKSIDVVA